MNPINSSEESHSVRWAVLQVDAGTNPEKNLDQAQDLIRQAGESCSLVALPEFFLVRGNHGTIRDQSITMQSETVRRMAQIAEDVNVNVLAGSMPFKDSSHPERCYNRSLLFDRSGEICARYDKIHLFDLDLDQGMTVRESELLQSGEGGTTTHVDGFSAGMSICYDLRFPTLYRQYASKKVDVLFVPSNFTRETGRAHWEPLLRARAIENQAYVLAPNQIGINPETGVNSLGQSLIVDPWGQVVARCSDREAWVSAELDRSYLRRIRRELPSLEHRTLGT